MLAVRGIAGTVIVVPIRIRIFVSPLMILSLLAVFLALRLVFLALRLVLLASRLVFLCLGRVVLASRLVFLCLGRVFLALRLVLLRRHVLLVLLRRHVLRHVLLVRRGGLARPRANRPGPDRVSVMWFQFEPIPPAPLGFQGGVGRLLDGMGVAGDLYCDGYHGSAH
jgi:hypothetical protein